MVLRCFPWVIHGQHLSLVFVPLCLCGEIGMLGPHHKGAKAQRKFSAIHYSHNLAMNQLYNCLHLPVPLGIRSIKRCSSPAGSWAGSDRSQGAQNIVSSTSELPSAIAILQLLLYYLRTILLNCRQSAEPISLTASLAFGRYLSWPA